MDTSTKFKLKLRDYIQGILMAVGTSILVVLQNSLQAEQFTLNWHQIGMAAVGAIITYLAKNFLTNDVKVAEKIMDDSQKDKMKQFYKQ